MKKARVIFFFLIISSKFCNGQFLTDPRAKMGFFEIEMPLIVIDSFETNFSSLIIQSENLRILKEYDKPAGLASFGEKGKGGVVIATLKAKCKLLRLPEVLRIFKISDENQKLQVLVNKALVNPNWFLADVNQIERIEIIKQDAFALYLYSFNKEEQYLNIVTIKN